MGLIVEERSYHVFTGRLPEVVRLYAEEGTAVQQEILGNLVGAFTVDVGDALERGAELVAGGERLEVGDNDLRALALEPRDDCGTDALRAAGDDRDLAVQCAHQRSGENDVGIMIRFRWVWISGWIFARKGFHRSSAERRARRASRSAKSS